MNKSLQLNNGIKIPQIGLGVFLTPAGNQTSNAVTYALKAGYRHIDTAMIYKNEQSVGDAIFKSNIDRKDIFITTKLWNDDVRSGNIKGAFNDSLKRLKTNYIDLYLIHWPAKGYTEAWKQMEELYCDGKIRAIGVSNFNTHHLDDIYSMCKIKPMINQIESNPYFNNQDLISYCQNSGITVEAWSPFGGTGTKIFNNQNLIELAKKYNKSPAQILIRWHLQRGVVVLPKSVHQERIVQNINVYDFELTQEEIEMINNLNTNIRTGSDPDNFNF